MARRSKVSNINENMKFLFLRKSSCVTGYIGTTCIGHSKMTRSSVYLNKDQTFCTTIDFAYGIT